MIEEFLTIHGNRIIFISVFTRPRQQTSWASLIQSTPSHPIYLISILILSPHLHLGLLSDFFPSGFLIKTSYAFLISPIHAICHAHLILLDFIKHFVKHKSYEAPHYVDSFSLLPLPPSLFSDTLNIEHGAITVLHYTKGQQTKWVRRVTLV